MNSNSTKCEQFMSTDFKGNTISTVKLDVSRAYDNIPELLQKFINENDISSWKKICEKIDYLYFNIGIGLTSLDNENNFIQKIKREVNSGKKLSNLEKIRPDLYIEGMFFGKGIWPSWYTVEYIKYLLDIYGSESYYEISLDSMYGFAFRYADKTMNNGDYTGGINQIEDNKYSINKYFEALSNNEEPLKFIMYVPVGYGKLNGKNVPNVIETKNKLKIFTVEFNCIW